MLMGTSLEKDSKYTPSFEEGDVVRLKKDCYSYNVCAEFDSFYFKKVVFVLFYNVVIAISILITTVII